MIDLRLGDCLDVMRSIPDRSIDAVITSPPYNCGKDYGTYSDDLDWDAYWNNTRGWLTESLRVMSDGARLAVNIAWWIGKKPRRSAVFELHAIASDVGFTFIDKIIWIKGSENGVRGDLGTGWGTWLSPSGPSVRCATEPILIYSKGPRGRRKITGEGRGKCEPNDMSKQEFVEYTTDAWFVQGSHDREHPAAFPAEIPHRLTKLYTWQGDTILDPFAGSGTTLIAALKLERNAIGIEISPDYYAIAQRRIQEAQAQLTMPMVMV